MSGVKRVYVEKKPDYAVAAKALRHEIRRYLGIMDVTGVRVLIRYDVENISDETFEKACSGVFAEPPVDILYKESFSADEGSRSFSVEYLPGQFDQRADSAEIFLMRNLKPSRSTASTRLIPEKRQRRNRTPWSRYLMTRLISPCLTDSRTWRRMN